MDSVCKAISTFQYSTFMWRSVRVCGNSADSARNFNNISQQQQQQHATECYNFVP